MTESTQLPLVSSGALTVLEAFQAYATATNAMKPADPITLPANDVLAEDVPEFLDHALRRWIIEAIGRNETFATVVALRLRIAPKKQRQALPSYALALASVGRSELLRVINAILKSTQNYDEASAKKVVELQSLLINAGSAFDVVANDNRPELARRMDSASRDSVEMTIANAPSAGSHLRKAWMAAYGVQPDPDKAYAESVKAVEAVAAKAIPTTSTRPHTLGDAISILRGDLQKTPPASWQFVIPQKDGTTSNAATVLAMLETLWNGHRSRHGGGSSARSNTQQEAEAAFHLAATLVRWLESGALYK